MIEVLQRGGVKLQEPPCVLDCILTIGVTLPISLSKIPLGLSHLFIT